MPESKTSISRALTGIRDLIDAGRPLIYVHTPEEQRVDALLREAAERLFPAPGPALFRWTQTSGLLDPQGQCVVAAERGPMAALDFVVAYDQPALFHFVDLHVFLNDSAIVRRLRDIYTACLDAHRIVFLSSPVAVLPAELARDIVLIDLPLPDLHELRSFVEGEIAALASSGVTADSSPATTTQLARALMGLTLNESRHALRRAVAANPTLGAASIPYLLEEKHLLVKKKTGVIEYVPNPQGLESVGGAPILKKWLLERRSLFDMGDDVAAEIVPKGILLMGISGCGKSLAVKAIGSCFNLPLYRIDMIEIFSGRHGNPESTFVSACRTLEEMAPAVLWFDEIEMGVSSRNDDAAGTLGRIFAFFLTWMQEKTRGLFVAATANRIDLLPAEMIRKGRFDEVFFVDLPSEQERLEIAKIHLQRRGFDPVPLQVERILQFTRGWTGAEIEQCVVSAITTAKLAKRELDGDDLLNMTAKIVPLSQTMKEQVEHIRGWALDRAVRTAPRSQGAQ